MYEPLEDAGRWAIAKVVDGKVSYKAGFRNSYKACLTECRRLNRKVVH